MKKGIKTIALPVLGALIVIAGFVYDIFFAGIPFQDPTPSMQDHYEFHSFIAGLFYKSGGLIFLIGMFLIPIIWKKINKE